MKNILMLGTAFVAIAAASTAQAQERYVTTSSTNSHVVNTTTQVDGVHTSPLTGLYVGGQGGYSWTDADISSGPDPKADGWDYGAFVGYKVDALLDSTINDNFGLGINGAVEGFYNWSDADDTVDGIKVEKDHSWGVNFRPGLSFVDQYTSPLGFNPYAILGYRRTQYTTKTTGFKDSNGYNGFDLGIGTELIAYGNYGVRLDYTHTFYADNNNISPDEDNVLLGVAYHF